MLTKTKKPYCNKSKLLYVLSELTWLITFVQNEINTRRDEGKFKMRYDCKEDLISEKGTCSIA
jgi:hypothetical protein